MRWPPPEQLCAPPSGPCCRSPTGPPGQRACVPARTEGAAVATCVGSGLAAPWERSALCLARDAVALGRGRCWGRPRARERPGG